MGAACNSKSKKEGSSSRVSMRVNTYENVQIGLHAPPNLLQKRLPSNFGLIVDNQTLKDKLINEELNKNLESGGKIDSALAELITTNSIKEKEYASTSASMFE